jgi:hypothetical protein
MRKKSIVSVFIIILSFFAIVSANDAYKGNCTIQGIGKLSDGTTMIWFNEITSVSGILNGFPFIPTMIATADQEKELVAMLISAQNNVAKLDIWYDDANFRIKHFKIHN